MVYHLVKPLTRRFKSNYFVSGLGFNLWYDSTNVPPNITRKIGECGGNFTTPYGILTSPSYPEIYPSHADCLYTISAPIGTLILLKFHSMHLPERMDCWRSYGSYGDLLSAHLQIIDGNSETSPILDTICGNEVPAPIRSNHNLLEMK